MDVLESLRSHAGRHLRATMYAVCLRVIDHPLFGVSYGSAGEHHCYEGGLAVHTLEVLEYAIQMAHMMPQAEMPVVVVSAIFHDFMKIREYEPKFFNGDFCGVDKTAYRKLVRHVAGSHAEFVRFTDELDETDLSCDTRIKIEHALLAHHGRYAWGSPIEPQLVEATILHYADQFSVHFGAGSKGKQE